MLKTNARTLLKNYNHNIKNPNENSRLLDSKPTKLRARIPMKRESSVVNLIRKHTPSRNQYQYQKRLELKNAKITKLEKRPREANLKNAQL